MPIHPGNRTIDKQSRDDNNDSKGKCCLSRPIIYNSYYNFFKKKYSFSIYIYIITHDDNVDDEIASIIILSVMIYKTIYVPFWVAIFIASEQKRRYSR